MLGASGRGVTELARVDSREVDMLIGSLATSLGSGGGFCAGSNEVVEHQRISGAGYVFSAAMPAILATTASESLKIIQKNPSVFAQLKENTKMFRALTDKSEYVFSPSAQDSPIIHLCLWPEYIKDGKEGDRMLQDVVDECLANGVLVTRSRHIAGQERWKFYSSIKVCVTTGFTKRELEKAGMVVRSAISKVVKLRK